MKYAVFSDVHGNLPALQAMIVDAGPVDGYISLGDVVDFGPWSNECVDLVDSLNNCVCLIGNHEQVFLSGFSKDFTPLALIFFEHCKRTFDRHQRIKQYLPYFQIGSFTCQHTILGRYIYPDTELDLDRNYFIGHSHYQFVTKSNGFKLYNPGSVGRNNQDLATGQYLIFDTVLDTVDLRSFSYDVDTLIEKMKKDKYPEVCIQYYISKLRTP